MGVRRRFLLHDSQKRRPGSSERSRISRSRGRVHRRCRGPSRMQGTRPSRAHPSNVDFFIVSNSAAWPALRSSSSRPAQSVIEAVSGFRSPLLSFLAHVCDRFRDQPQGNPLPEHLVCRRGLVAGSNPRGLPTEPPCRDSDHRLGHRLALWTTSRGCVWPPWYCLPGRRKLVRASTCAPPNTDGGTPVAA